MEWIGSQNELVNAITQLGFPEGLGIQIAKQLGSPKASSLITAETTDAPSGDCKLCSGNLFGRDVKTIGKHIGNALKEELDNSTVAKIAEVCI